MQRGGPIKHHAVRMPWYLYEVMAEHAKNFGVSGNRLMVACISMALESHLGDLERRLNVTEGKGKVGKENSNSSPSN